MQDLAVRKLTIDDIAKELGVSKTTVSRAISGKGRIGEETRQRVLNYIELHNYKPSALAQGLAMSCTSNIGMVVPADLLSVDMSFFAKALKGISETAAQEEYDLVMTIVDRNDLSRLEHVLENHKVDGLILMRTLYDDKPAGMLKKSGIPFVAVGQSDDPEVYQIDNDHAEACREMTSILLLKGLKKIAFVAGDMNYIINRKRLEGFYKAHAELEMPLNGAMVFTDVNSALHAARVADIILMRHANCIIGADDLLAKAVLDKLEEEDVYIPKEMRLASFFDSPLLASSKVGVSSIKFDVAELGREACRVLLRRIRGEEVPHITQLPYEVALRESTK